MVAAKKPPDKMSSASKPTASRSGTAGNKATSSRGRLDGRAWRDVARAVEMAKKNDAHAVEIHGVRMVFKRIGPKPPLETTGGSGPEKRAARKPVETTCGPAPRTSSGPNSAQRRSAKRLQEFLLAQKGAGTAKSTGPPPSAEPSSTEPARVDPDVRAGAETMDTTEEERRGQKRAASESPVCAPKPSALLQQLQGYKGQRVGGQVGSTGRKGPGLGRHPPERLRQIGAARALEKRRETHRGEHG